MNNPNKKSIFLLGNHRLAKNKQKSNFGVHPAKNYGLN